MSNLTITFSAESDPVEGSTLGSYRIVLSSPAPVGGLTVNFDTIGSTATLNDDYTFAAGDNLTPVTDTSFTIAAGATTATLKLIAKADAVVDPNETVVVNLLDGADYSLSTTIQFNPLTYNAKIGYRLIANDFNNDGKQDIAYQDGYYYDPNRKVSILSLNSSNTGFDTPISINIAAYDYSLYSGDFNGDAKPDLITTNYDYYDYVTGKYYYKVSLLSLNNSNTAFDTPITYISDTYTSSSPVVGDFNGDGKQDLISFRYDHYDYVTGKSYYKISILSLNDSNTAFNTPITFISDIYPYNMLTGDFNGDGKQDLISSSYDHYDANTGKTYYKISIASLNDSNTEFNTLVSQVIDSGYMYPAYIGDFNGDGKQDTITSSSFYYNNSLYYKISVLSLNNSNTGFDTLASYNLDSYLGASVIADFNNDGKQDLAVSHGTTISVLSLNSSNTGFEVMEYALDSSASAFVASDFNNDGQLDLAVAHGYYDYSNYQSYYTVSILLNNGTGFDKAVDYAVDSYIYNLVTGDFDGDGQQDLAFYQFGKIVILQTQLNYYHNTASQTITQQGITVNGNTSNNKLYGTENGDSIYGFDGDDTMNGLSDADQMFGGIGNDIYIVDNKRDKVWEEINAGLDTVISSTDCVLSDNIEQLALTGTDNLKGHGNNLNNYLQGNSADNTLNGWAGSDSMKGSAGNDCYIVDDSNDWVAELDSEGVDKVYAYISYALTANVENLILVGNATNAYGNTLNNQLVGNDYNNILDGWTGIDTLSGGKGNDIYIVGDSDDVVWEGRNQGLDRIYSKVSYVLTDSSDIEVLCLIGTEAINATGNNKGNYLKGNSGNNTLYGQEGSDNYIGGLGQDHHALYEGKATTDTLLISTGDSLVNSYDWVTNFSLGKGNNGTSGVDKLDLDSTAIAANTSKVAGIHAGIVYGHSINNGIISVVDNTYGSPLTISQTNLDDVLDYLQANIIDRNTVAFLSEGNTFVFQDGGSIDTLVELVGVAATSLSTTGIQANSVWIG